MLCILLKTSVIRPDDDKLNNAYLGVYSKKTSFTEPLLVPSKYATVNVRKDQAPCMILQE